MAASVLVRHRFTVEEFEQMIETGILAEDLRVELLAGEIVEMSPIGVRHMTTINVLAYRAFELLGRVTTVSVQNAIRLDGRSRPQPDLALLRPRRAWRALPTPADIFLVIEVADSTLDADRAIKLPLYAAAGIAESWLVNLQGSVIERHSEPRDGIYTAIAIAGRGQTLASLVLPDFNVVVDELLDASADGDEDGDEVSAP